LENNDNPFIDDLLLLSNEEILKIVNNKNDVLPEVYEAAMEIATERNIQKKIDSKKNLSSLNGQKEKRSYSYSDIKNGLNNLFMSSIIFYVAFIIATAFNLNFYNRVVGYSIIGALGLLSFFLKINFFPNEENDDKRPNTYSRFAMWFAIPFIDHRNFKNPIYVGPFSRRSLINLIVVLPFFLFVFMSSGIFTSSKKEIGNHSDFVTTRNQSTSGQNDNSIRTMQAEVDSSKKTLIEANINWGNNLYDDKEYTDAINRFKSALVLTGNDTTLFLKIGNCFHQLKQNDSAKVYWKKSESLGCKEAKKKLG